jgi:hypothetical protein
LQYGRVICTCPEKQVECDIWFPRKLNIADAVFCEVASRIYVTDVSDGGLRVGLRPLSNAVVLNLCC